MTMGRYAAAGRAGGGTASASAVWPCVGPVISSRAAKAVCWVKVTVIMRSPAAPLTAETDVVKAAGSAWRRTRSVTARTWWSSSVNGSAASIPRSSR
jgi:hypothetical protein